MQTLRVAALACLVAVAAASISAKDNYHPVSITVDQAPFDILATPITPDAPYSQRDYQCNLTGDSRYPPYAPGTFPLDIAVPLGKRVRVIFANGNLNGDTTTLAGEPGVIVQQGGLPIVQQSGGATPIVQKIGSPVVQQNNAPAAAYVVQQTPTVVQHINWPAAPSVPAGPVIDQGDKAPASPTTPTSPPPPAPTTTPVPTPPRTSPSPPATPIPTNTPVPTNTPANTTSPSPPAIINAPPQTPPVSPSSPPVVNMSSTTATPSSPTNPPPAATLDYPTPPASAALPSPPTGGRKLLQDRVPGGPNNGLVEYVALASANTVPGFYAGSTQFGVPYIEFTATEAAIGQTANFKGVLEVAQVIGGVPQYPFRPNPSLSPECQINVNFRVATV